MKWSVEDGQFVATCAKLPSQSWQADSQTAALQGLVDLVADTGADITEESEAVPEPLATVRAGPAQTTSSLQCRQAAGDRPGRLRGGQGVDRPRGCRGDHFAFTLNRYEVAPLADRIWQLRHQYTSYDAAYLALAEALEAPLYTCDAKLDSGGHHAKVLYSTERTDLPLRVSARRRVDLPPRDKWQFRSRWRSPGRTRHHRAPGGRCC